MKYKIIQDKGITMIALVVTIIILLILTNVLIYNAKDSIHIKALTNLYNDIDLLREKVSEYYNEYGEIPAEIKYTNVNQLSNVLNEKEKNDISNFYVIDLEAMQGISLNYGKDYKKIKDDQENINKYEDVYIINRDTHNIFYAQGINIKENNTTKTYYTDYTTPDETTVDLRYIDGILIPDGYYYIGKEKDGSGNESIVISKNKDDKIDSTSTTQYLWQKNITYIDTIPDSIELSEGQNEYEFLNSVNHYKGYFKNKNKNVIYLTVKENKWSEIYTENKKYVDKNGDEAYIPQGFRVSIAEGTNEIKSGLVITDQINESNESIGNEFVWVPVDDFQEFVREDFGKVINQEDFITTEPTAEKYYEPVGDGETIEELNESIKETQAMYKSVKEYKGFYIGRYETGIELETQRSSNSGTTQDPVIKRNKYIYNYITWGNSNKDGIEGAVELAKRFINNRTYRNSVNSTLCYGVQWDAILRWINKNTSLNYILEDSIEKGNYETSGKLIKSGNYEEYQIKNIYDLAGNVSEWTMESYGIENKVLRGGKSGSTENITYRESNGVNYESELCGFRITLYIK